MPERAITTKSATGFLLILVPAALAMSALFVAWPYILGLTVLVAGGNIWQNYEWAKTARSIEPSFQQLVVQNRGEITPIDLSLKANVSGKVATRYLVTKADEFGTRSRQYPDRGQVFYFISVSTLGNIFDDSEREAAPAAIMPAQAPVVATPVAFRESIPTVTAVTQQPSAPEVVPPPIEAVTPPSVTDVSPIRQSTETTPSPETLIAQPPTSDLSNLAKLLDERSVSTNTEPLTSGEATPRSADTPLITILQSDLAKRLDVHSSTVYKRRSEASFTDWTRNRDPEGLAWGYDESSKEYYQVTT
jgi:uncharacterized membrane protein